MTDANIANRGFRVRALGPGFTECDYAEAERPQVYSDVHSGPVSDGRDPAAVRERLAAQLERRRNA